MVIRLSKGRNGGSRTLTCVRDDGTSTWQRSSDFFAYHDLIHYAVETTLGYREAFLGLVAQGRDLDSFGTRDGVKDVYTEQEGWAEGITGAVQWPMATGNPPMTDQDVWVSLVQTCEAHGAPPPPVTARQIGEIREIARELHRRWESVPEGGVMELTF
jgi:hypothetical protein